jgi:hypothetical protein
MGDVFDDEWQKMCAEALPHAKEQGKVFHSIRHWCNNEMKQAKVTVKFKRDVFGQSNGADVNSGRYSDPASLALMSPPRLSSLAIPNPAAAPGLLPDLRCPRDDLRYRCFVSTSSHLP